MNSEKILLHTCVCVDIVTDGVSNAYLVDISANIPETTQPITNISLRLITPSVRGLSIKVKELVGRRYQVRMFNAGKPCILKKGIKCTVVVKIDFGKKEVVTDENDNN